MMYRIGWLLSLLIARLYVGVRVSGARHIPKTGPFILASNHESNMDPFILGTSFPRPIEYMAKEELFRHPISRWIFTGFHAHPVRRGNGDYGALKETFRILEGGNGLLIFPEGTRSRTGGLQPAKPGIGFIVARSGVPVVPAYIEGSREAMPDGFSSLRRRQVRISFGEPVRFTDSEAQVKGRDRYQEISDAIMSRIASLRDEDTGRAR